MEQIDGEQAREHIELIERILAASSQRLCFGGEYFLVWGLYSSLVAILAQLTTLGRFPVTAFYVVIWVALAAAVVFSIVHGRAKRNAATRLSLLQREFFNVLYLTLFLAFVTNVACFRLFGGENGWGKCAIWSFAEAIVVLYIGMHGNRRAQIAGIALVASMIVANFVSWSIAGYVLAAGMLLGYAGFGLAEMLARD